MLEPRRVKLVKATLDEHNNVSSVSHMYPAPLRDAILLHKLQPDCDSRCEGENISNTQRAKHLHGIKDIF